MKNSLFAFLIIFSVCMKADVSSAQIRPSKKKVSNPSQKELKVSVQQSPSKKKPKWIAGNYKGLQPGKSTLEDVKRIFGKPKMIIHPEDGEDNPIESRLDYVYENEPQTIIDKKSGIVLEIWGGNNFSNLSEAIEQNGNDFYKVEFTKKGCIFKEYKKDEKADYPLYLSYPQKGFYFAVNKNDEVVVMYYVAKCGD